MMAAQVKTTRLLAGLLALGIYLFTTQPLSAQSPTMSKQENIKPAHEKINYLEYPAKDLDATKKFFSDVFGWTFADYGPDYIAFSNQGIDGGFFRSDLASATKNGAALTVFYSDDLEATLEKVSAGGGEIIQAIFSFPGGRRFHFAEPSGNEFAVWGN
jgi:predicted enzyme related to lactoylglutathione lyase